MFKSIFTKYILAFMLIILFCFAMLTAITTVTVNGYAGRAKADVVSRATDAAGKFLNARLGENNADVYGLVTDEPVATGEVLETVAGYSDDLTILITDVSGHVLLKVTRDGISIPDGVSIPEEAVKAAGNGDFSMYTLGKVTGLFDTPQMSGVSPLTADDGSKTGFVFVCASSDTLSDLRDVMVKAIFMSSLWVMLAAFIAVYFITDKVTAPLKDMSRAAKSFASGDFTVRVRVRGNDEVSELATAFNNMANSLEASEKMRNSFMANVSHDLRTPMTTISGFIDGILDGAIPPEKHEYYLNIITVEVKRLSRLVTQLLDISRIEAGDRKFNMQPFDVCEMARQILISFEQKIDAKKLDVEFFTDGDYMYAEADRDAIYQILYNLCDNAVKFSNEGGKLKVSITYSPDGKKLITEVYNEGQGIKPDDLPYVFERFYKGDKSRGLDKSGVGLGLYISKTIIDAHKQTISADSEYGKYCRFTFTLANAKEQA